MKRLKKQKLINEDSEASYAYYCLHKFHWLPSKFNDLDDNEKAFIIAAIQIKTEKEKKESAKMKNKGKKK